MWKVSCLFLLIILFDNCSTFESSRLSKSPKNIPDYDDQGYQSDIDEAADYDKEDYEPEDESEEFQEGRLIGKWRSNGEAIEPKWRDGDSIPLVPFEAATNRRKGLKPRDKPPAKYQEPDEPNLRFSSIPPTDSKPLPVYVPAVDEVRVDFREELHEPTRYNDYANSPRNSSRRYRTRKQKPLASPAEEEEEEQRPGDGYVEREPVQQTSSYGYERRQRHEAIGDDDKEVKVRVEVGNYNRSPFQAYPKDYELNNEEYQRPRPRKRRPPQNYEFIESKTLYPSLESSRRRPDASNAARKDPRPRVSVPENQKVSENSELKSLLKMQQIEGLSLSEILQRRNLTLSDLLKGKSETINALKSNEAEEQDLGQDPSKDRDFLSKQRDPTTSERPRWMTSARPRIKEPRRNQVQRTTAEGSPWTEVHDNVSSKETIESSIEDNEGKSNDEKLSTIVRLTKPIILPRLNSFTGRPSPIVITTTTTTTTTIRSIAKEPVAQYANGKRVTTVQSIDDDEIMEFSDFSAKKTEEEGRIATPLPTIITKPDVTTFRHEVTTVMSQYNEVDKDIGSTLSIEHILSPTPSTFTTPVDNKSNTLIEYNGSENHADDMDYQNDGPSMANEGVNAETAVQGHSIDSTTIKERDEDPLPANHRNSLPNNKIYEEEVSEVEPETRAEIFELISSSSSAHRLERLLKSRNMSIDELIELRQRGSSQVHLAEISRSRSKPQRIKSKDHQASPLPSGTAVTRISSSSSFTTASSSKSTKGSENTTPVSISSTLDSIHEEENKNNNSQRFIAVDKQPVIIKFSSRNDREYKGDRTKTDRDPVQLVDLLSAFDSLPFTVHNRPVTTSTEFSTSTEVSIVTRIESTTKSESTKKLPEVIVEVTKRPEVSTDMMEVGLVEEIAQEIEAMEEESLPTTEENYTRNPQAEDDRKILSKVRPSIIASGAILGMTIVGFLAIFIVCRIRQKQRYMYKNSFSKAVFQAPVMNARKLSNSSSLNTIMVNVVATSTTKRSIKHETQEVEETFDCKSDIENDSLDANDSWETIPDFMK